MEFFAEVWKIAVSTATLAVVFWLISLLLAAPENKTEGLKNFHAAHPPGLINKEFKCEIFYPLIGVFVSHPMMVFLFFAVLQLNANIIPHQIFADQIKSLPFVVQVLIGLLIVDFSLWVRHGFVHRYFWSFHAVHHSAKEITWLTSRRVHPVDVIIMGLIDTFILYMIGFSAESMVFAFIIKDLNNMFVHSNIVLDYPKPLKYIIVSPNMHRWHHATEKEAHDKNFCVVFAFIDYFLGTYYVPDNALPKAYGSDFPALDDIANKDIVTELLMPFRLVRPTDPAAPPATVSPTA